MEDNTNKDHISQQNNERENSPEPPQVPPSLLPTVLHRLGLTLEQAQQEMSVEEAMVKLKSNDWGERAKAVRFLGKRAAVIPLELLEAALEDEDGTVRATAVHAIGHLGKQAPLHRLVQALHDSDWHVRETAVFVLAKQGPRVPDEVFEMVLYDTDSSVREAARYVLQRHVFPIETFTQYGQLQEKKMMQQDSDAIQTNSRGGRSPYETEPSMALHANNEYHGYAESFYNLREQSQVYAPQEQIPYEYRTDRHDGEKITSLPQRGSSKKWWIIIPTVAILFFLLGVMSVGLFSVRSSSQVAVAQPGVGNIAQPQISGDPMLALFRVAKYNSPFENEVSSGLNLTQEQILAQLQAGKSMTDIATAQGISTAQLRQVETGAFTDTLQAMVKDGDVSQSAADAWQVRTLRNPGLIDMWTSMIFLLPRPVPGSN